MLKEIFEQENTVRDTFRSRISLEEGRVDLEDVLPAEKAKLFHKICIVACGICHRRWIRACNLHRNGVNFANMIRASFRFRRIPKLRIG